jgi:hypothetical protein
MWSAAELQRHKRAAIEAAISDKKRRLENAAFYRSAPGLSAGASKQWDACISDLKAEIAQLAAQ